MIDAGFEDAYHFLNLEFYKLERPLKTCHVRGLLLTVWSRGKVNGSDGPHRRRSVHKEHGDSELISHFSKSGREEGNTYSCSFGWHGGGCMQESDLRTRRCILDT